MFKQSLKPYEKYNPVNYDYVMQLPEGWELLPNIAVFDERISKGHTDEELLSVTIGKGIIKQTENDIKKDSSNEDKSNYKLVKEGDIAYNKMRMWQGAVGYSQYRGIVSPAYIVLKPKMTINPEYFHYILRINFYTNYSKRFSYGIVDDQLSLRYKDFKRMYSIVPPFEIQNRIVEYLNHKTKQADTLIEKQTRCIELLKEQKKAIINKAVTKGLNPDAQMKDSGIEWLGEIPAHWEVRKLKYLVKINKDTLTERTNKNFEFDYIDISSISENGLFLEPEKIKFKDAPSRARRIVKRGDTIISTVRTYLRAIEYFNDIKNYTVASTGFAVLSPSQKVHEEYLSYLIRNEYFLNKVTANSVGIAYPAISTHIMSGFYLPIPEISEQQNIVEYVETKIAKIDQAIEKAEKEITLVKEYLQSLIYQIVTGQLKIHN